MQSLRVAEAIRDQSGGEPYDPQDLATALSMTPGQRDFRRLIESSSDYGLTEGSWSAKEISLTERGRSIVMPKTSEEYQTALRNALLSIDVFKNFLNRYDRKKLPEAEFVKNTLVRDLGIPPEEVKSCFNIIVENAEEMGILVDDVQGSLWIRMDKLSEVEQEFEELTTDTEKEPESDSESEEIPRKSFKRKTGTRPKVFISHGKNLEIVRVVKDILSNSGYEPIVSIEEETLAKPVSEKIVESMHQCDFGIMNLSLDEREKRDDGTYGVNQNVLIEVGAAYVLYNKKIILLADKRVKVPSNISGLYQCRYEGDQLGADTIIKLLKTIKQFTENEDNQG